VLEKLAARLGVGLLLPEACEVIEDCAGFVEIGARSGREAVELSVKAVALGNVRGLLVRG
jgi:hypothetical protein